MANNSSLFIKAKQDQNPPQNYHPQIQVFISDECRKHYKMPDELITFYHCFFLVDSYLNLLQTYNEDLINNYADVTWGIRTTAELMAHFNSIALDAIQQFEIKYQKLHPEMFGIKNGETAENLVSKINEILQQSSQKQIPDDIALMRISDLFIDFGKENQENVQ